MEFSGRRIADAVVAVPTGQVDHVNALRLQELLAPLLSEAAASKCALVLDFSDVDYISSMGLRVLMMAAKEMRAHGAAAAVAGLQPAVREIFDIARFQYVLAVYPSVGEALRQLAPAAADAYGKAAG